MRERDWGGKAFIKKHYDLKMYFHVLFMFVYNEENLVVEWCISDVILWNNKLHQK